VAQSIQSSKLTPINHCAVTEAKHAFDKTLFHVAVDRLAPVSLLQELVEAGVDYNAVDHTGAVSYKTFL